MIKNSFKKICMLIVTALYILSGTAMATDFYAFTELQGVLTALHDLELASIEGGQSCSINTGGVSYLPGGCILEPTIMGGGVVANDAPVTGAHFLQVTGGL